MGDRDGLWGLTEHLLGLNLDELRVANWQRANEGAPKGKRTRAPEPVARPGTKAAAKHSPERVAAREAARTRALKRAAARRAAIARGDIT